MLNKVRDFIDNVNFKLIMTKDYIYIENYKRLITIEKELIIISFSNGKIKIKGNDLSVRKLLDNEVLINGKVLIIEVVDE